MSQCLGCRCSWCLTHSSTALTISKYVASGSNSGLCIPLPEDLLWLPAPTLPTFAAGWTCWGVNDTWEKPSAEKLTGLYPSALSPRVG